MAEKLTADDVIAHHKLEPHPEGGWFRETFRDEAVEVWHWYGGAPLELQLTDNKGTRDVYKLGPDIAAGEHPQGPVPAFAWQSARSLGEWTLVGCTVAPGFDFAGFELAPEGWEP